MALRQAEIAREENLLERDRVRLAVLERDAAREEAIRQQQTKKVSSEHSGFQLGSFVLIAL